MPTGLPSWFSILSSSQSHKPSHCMCVTSFIFNHPVKENSLCLSQRRGMWNPPKARLPQDARPGRGRAQGEFLSVPVTVYAYAHFLISGYFLCTDLEVGCRGQGWNSYWVMMSMKPLLQASKSLPPTRGAAAPDGKLPCKCPHNGWHYSEAFLKIDSVLDSFEP